MRFYATLSNCVQVVWCVEVSALMSHFNVVFEATFICHHRWEQCRPSGGSEVSVGLGPGAYAPGYIMPLLRSWRVPRRRSSALAVSDGLLVLAALCDSPSWSNIEPTASHDSAPRAIFGHSAEPFRNVLFFGCFSASICYGELMFIFGCCAKQLASWREFGFDLLGDVLMGDVVELSR